MAVGGLDFVARRADLNLANSITRVCECIQLLPDELAEGSEEFDVVVSSSHPGILGSRSIVTIKDDDGMERVKPRTPNNEQSIKLLLP